MKTKFCSTCGKKIHIDAEICPKCGVRAMHSRGTKNPGVAAVLSVLLPGLGQIYNGDIGRGLIIILILFPLFVLLFFVLIGIPLFIALYIWSIYDAYKTAENLNLKGGKSQ